MERLFFRKDCPKERESGSSLDRMNIAVAGLGQNVGTTLVASSLAFYFAEKGNFPTYVQCLTPAVAGSLLYDQAGFDKRFMGRSFADFYSLIKEDSPLKGKANKEAGVNWILPTPLDCDEGVDLDRDQKARLMRCMRGAPCIFDMEAGEDWDRFLLDMDLILVVADPLPSKLIRQAGRFAMLKKLELSGIPVRWIVNRTNSGVSRRQVRGYLKTSDIIWIPEFAPELCYGDEYFCRFHWENEEIRSQLLAVFTKVSQEMGF